MMELMRQRLSAAKDAPENSFLQSSPWKTLQATLPSSLLLFEYEDTAATIKYMRNTMQQFWPMMVMGIQKQGGLQLPAVLPMVDHLVQNISYSTAYAWADDTTLRYHSEGPMGAMSSSSMSGVAGGALGVSILMPALGRARESAKMAVCANNLHQIGIAALTYHEEHHQFPPSLQTLVESEIMSAESLRCPADDDKSDDCSYIYRGADLTMNMNCPGEIILAHDKYGNHSDTRNLLFLDGHVDRMDEFEFQLAIARDNELRKQAGMEEILFDGPALSPVELEKYRQGQKLRREKARERASQRRVQQKETPSQETPAQPGKDCSTF